MTRRQLRWTLMAGCVAAAVGFVVALLDPFWLPGLDRFVGFELDIALIVVGAVWVRRSYLQWRLGRSGETL